jgi:hypothetical protein
MPSRAGTLESLEPVPHASSPFPTAPATARQVAPLARATPVVPTSVTAAAATARAAPDDQPTVRVHIGRLEVRANLEQPAPKPQRRQEPRTPELSLSDYLRGRQAQ